MSRPLLPESAYAALGLSPEAIKDLMNPKPPPPEPPEIHAPNLLQSDEDNARPMSPNETCITLYAELLLHIRTVTLFASLRTNFSRSTDAKLSSDGSYITVSHEGQSASIRLPINIEGGGDAALELPSQPPTKELTLRLQLEEREGSDLLGALQREDRQANIVPWDGASLNDARDVEITCKSCESVLVSKGKIRQWKDLPNENWAEMMDFWHCHKPDEHHLHHHGHEEVVGQKGYAAGNRLQAAEGLGFVDLASFLLAESDCDGAQIPSDEQGPHKDPIQCAHCNHMVGTNDPATAGWRIRKWAIGIRSMSTSTTPTSSTSSPTTYTVQKWITARLLHLIDNTGLRKFHIHTPAPPPPSDSNQENEPIPSLLVWVFTPDLLFSSSIPTPGRLDPTRTMKIFYQKQTWQALKPGEPESAQVEDVEFAGDLYAELEDALERSQRLLPPTAKKFQGWDVGLLERFEVLEAGMGNVGSEEGRNGKAGENKKAEENGKTGESGVSCEIPSEDVD
ncbi:ubiquitin-protein ligase E3 D [Alternaria panax]|uniref:Ubiquitin-protein ligase E3 D n=1 Tax=Alternaria panax TaxID=48097 RepID=A0AAD4I932_9PLEO|nr:ubiquitin-protein ligase E3 D [Alternaria panax]